MFCAGVVSVAFSSLHVVIAQEQEEEKPALTFCVCPNAMPRAGRAPDGTPQGVDIAVAELVARTLGRRCEFHWCGTDTCRLQSLKDGRCDVVIGLPADGIESPEILWTQPYASAKFGLMVSADASAARSLIELQGKRVGIVAGSVPLASKDHVVVGFPSREALVGGFAPSSLDGALIDVDFAAWSIKKRPQLQLRLVDEFVSQHRWNLGMAVRASDTALRDEISAAVDDLLRKAKFPPLFAENGLTHRPPGIAEAKPEPSVDAWREIGAGRPLVVSMDPDNLPYSSSDEQQPGFDVEIARLLAAELGVELQINWIDIHRETAIGQLLERECDLAMGAAIDPGAMDDEQELANKVIYSRPYYGAAYVLAMRSGAPEVRSLKELQGDKSRRLGTQAGTIADYRLRQRGYMRRLFGTQMAVLHSLDNNAIDYAYLWPNIGWILHTSPEIKAKLADNFEPEDRWNIAIAMRRDDAQLKDHVDRGLDQLMQRGVVAEALKRYHTPYFAPSGDSSEKTAALSEQQPKANKTLPQIGAPRSPIDRGLEPQMGRRQVSRKGYDGLSKIRARGSIVAGLDQNNLPFSTAHPHPAGLDYEIAALLARELNVSLEVYWAYSSHDSYPAKLAHKKVCDVMLGVMPDDRFGDEVAYSDPYYWAQYVVAVSTESEARNAETILGTGEIAVESGVAVQGLANRDVRRYASAEAILADIVQKKTSAGYLIASRAHWLVAAKWPNGIRFVAPQTPIDRFPICVALRQREPALQAAVNQGLKKLLASGEMQAVFQRWHVPRNEIVTENASIE